MAAKLEQPISPSFIRMVKLVKAEFHIEITKQEIACMEEAIIRVLDFDLTQTSALPFMERYARIFGVDNWYEDTEAE